MNYFVFDQVVDSGYHISHLVFFSIIIRHDALYQLCGGAGLFIA